MMLALELAHEGREGRPVGTAFIVGDIKELKRWSHQGVLNPYEGHPAEVRDVKIRENWESVKEFAQLDGVFIIDKNGIIEASGRYLDADGRDANLQSGLGGRHLATAAITKVAPAIGIVVSESGGVIRVFIGGKSIAQIRTDIRLVL
jgi:DNA integrity scanning protein DisA with diadenylate cyclase activity